MKHFLLSIILLTFSMLASATCPKLYNHQLVTLQGDDLNLCDYQNNPILVVNTASRCGFTPQFDALEELYETYKDKGLLVVGFPSNDFKQELSSNKKIGDFCKMTYGVEFPMVSKSVVTGNQANPLFQELIKTTGQAPMWNFYKYLIMPNGESVYVYSSDVKPNNEAILGRLRGALHQQSSR